MELNSNIQLTMLENVIGEKNEHKRTEEIITYKDIWE